MAEAGHPSPPAVVDLPRDLERLAAEVRLEQARALLRGAEDRRARSRGSRPRPRPAANPDPRASVIRAATFVGISPCSAIDDEQQVEEEALLLGRLVAGEQQVEVLGEA